MLNKITGDKIKDQSYTLSSQEALKIISFIQAKLEKQNRGAAAAVVDSHSELMAFLRTDNCPLPSINNAINKAFTAARTGRESYIVGQTSKAEGNPLTNYGDPRYIGWGGGVPLTFQGKVIGAVGVSGLPEQDDMALAKTSAALIG